MQLERDSNGYDLSLAFIHDFIYLFTFKRKLGFELSYQIRLTEAPIFLTDVIITLLYVSTEDIRMHNGALRYTNCRSHLTSGRISVKAKW